jgi:hypothetical protein
MLYAYFIDKVLIMLTEQIRASCQTSVISDLIG